MNFGTENLRILIATQLKRANANIPIGRGKFAKDLAKEIYELIEADMHPDMKAQARARGIPDAILDFSDRAGRAFGFLNMPLDEVSQEAYRWIMEQPQTIEAFAEWARKDEQGKFMAKYRKGAGNIRNDWARAFTAKPQDERLSIMESL